MQRGVGPMVAGLAAALVVLVGGSVATHWLQSPSSSPSTTTSTTLAVTTTTPASTTTSTTTTTPVGELPQTEALPPALTRGLTHRIKALVAAVATGNPALGYPAFFPVAAYVQTKTGYGNASDWHYRLLGHFDADVAALHAALGPHAAAARFAGYSVDDAQAAWVLPGEEENKGPYWRVYNTSVAYTIDGRRGYFNVSTMISWRGEWYVVHLTGYNS